VVFRELKDRKEDTIRDCVRASLDAEETRKLLRDFVSFTAGFGKNRTWHVNPLSERGSGD